MSVVVRMEMPEGCWGCPFGHYDWIWGDDGREKMVCFCCLDGESEEDGHYLLETEEKRPSWCPIICSLPEGHGRLIDADAFSGHMKEYQERIMKWREQSKTEGHEESYHRADSSLLTVVATKLILDNAPTIVPAERSENDGR